MKRDKECKSERLYAHGEDLGRRDVSLFRNKSSHDDLRLYAKGIVLRHLSDVRRLRYIFMYIC